MFKKTVIAMMLVSLPTFSHANKIVCPATVKAGTALKVSATITNDDCSSDLTINRTLVSLLGNSGSGSIGLQGPFVTPFANNFNTIIPHATCKVVPYTVGHPEWGTYTVSKPTSHTFSNLIVVNQVPVGMAGTLVVATAGVMDIGNEIKIAGVCKISVIK